MLLKKILLVNFLLGLQICYNILNAANNPSDSLLGLLQILDEKEQAHIFNELSNFSRNNPKKSIEYGEKALLLAKKYNLDKQIFDAYINLSDAHQIHDTLNKSIQYSNKALELAKTINDSLLIARAHFVIGSNYSNMGYQQEALNNLLQSLRIVERLYSKGDTLLYNKYLSFITNNIGNLYGRLDNTSKALEFYEYSLEKKTILNDSLGIANMLNNIGLLCAKEKDFIKAEDYYRRSLSIKEVIGNKEVITETVFNIWTLLIQQKQYRKALDYYSNIKNIESELTSRSRILMFNNLGDIYLALGMPEDAFNSISAAMNLANKTHSIDLLRTSNLLLSRYYFSIGEYKNAYGYQSKYILLNDSIRNEEVTSNMTEMQAKYESEKQVKQIAILKKDQQLKYAEIERQKAIKFVYLASFILIIIITILIISRIRIKQKRKQVELENRNLENEQKLLRSQMNPHFIFNSLNSIQGFISANNSFKAMGFLSKFGSLMRKILENSRETYISLENEIETLRLYIEMEKLRHNNIFEYEINTDKQLDIETVFIPPLIVQPFVENAIKHGLRPKMEFGKLLVKFKKEDEFLIITIFDNGVGRKTTEHLNSMACNHKSLGIKLTYERLVLLGEKTKRKTSFQINDLQDKDEKPKGTEVIIILPLKN